MRGAKPAARVELVRIGAMCYIADEYLSLGMLIKPYQQDEAFLSEVRRHQHEARGFRVWWLGQSGFLLQWQGKHLVFDPYLSDSLSRKYAQTDKPHLRMSERVIDPARLEGIDVLTSSHNHTDHLDAETLGPMLRANPRAQLVIPEANRLFVAERLGCEADFPIGLNEGEVVDIQGFRLIGVPAAHNSVERDAQGKLRYMGYVLRFGEYCVYHSGDTLWYEGMGELLKGFGVDVAFLPINGNLPERRVAGNLNAEEAARLGKAIGAKCVIPHHYDMFAFNTADPAEFVRYCEQYQTPYRVLQLGEGLAWENQ